MLRPGERNNGKCTNAFVILKMMQNKVFSVRSGEQTEQCQNQLVSHAECYACPYVVVF